MESARENAELQIIRWGVAGPGRAAGRFAEGLKVVPGASLDAVWGRTSERARDFAGRFQIESVFASFDDLIAADIDAVYVATHPDTHADLCLRALAAGKHVLCEKPATLGERQLKGVL